MIEDMSKNEVKADNDSGSLTCDVCEQTFDSMESYKEHKTAEIKDEEMAHRGVD
jgi:tRNA U54 and U55 pseudouridine synthase Pus10